MSRVDLSGALMHISDAKTFSPSIKKKKKKEKKAKKKKNCSGLYKRGKWRERARRARESLLL